MVAAALRIMRCAPAKLVIAFSKMIHCQLA
jgi:hypothetical protein